MITDADRARIAEAIRAAEAKTSAEVFCVVAGRASSHAFVPIAWAAVLALLVPWPFINFTTLTPIALYLVQLAVFAGLVALFWRPAMRYRLVLRRTRNERAHGLVAAVEQCGALLAEHLPTVPGAPNPDELPDRLVEI